MWVSLCVYWNFIILLTSQNIDETRSVSAAANNTIYEHQTSYNVVVYPVVAIVSLSPIIGFLAWCCHKKKFFKKQRRDSEDKSRFNAGFVSENETAKGNRNYFSECNEIDYKPSTTINNKYEVSRDNLSIIKVVGEGFFGKVLQAEALGLKISGVKEIVAIKTVKDNSPDCDKKDFISEIRIMIKLGCHPNVITFLGCCTGSDPIYLIMEWVPGGPLQAFLRACRQSQYYKPSQNSESICLIAKDLLSFAHQIAQGIQYIISKQILHRDLATRNVLIGFNKNCKICDFGLAREADNEIYVKTSSSPLPVRWMAPESLRDFIFTVHTEIWAFGILMWEILTFGSTPYAEVPATVVIHKVQEGYRLSKPEHCKRELYNLMYYCWNAEPDQRPSFNELENTLKNMLLTEINYVELEKFQDELYYNLTSAKGEKL